MTTAPAIGIAETAGSGDRRDDTSATNETPTDSTTAVKDEVAGSKREPDQSFIRLVAYLIPLHDN